MYFPGVQSRKPNKSFANDLVEVPLVKMSVNILLIFQPGVPISSAWAQPRISAFWMCTDRALVKPLNSPLGAQRDNLTCLWVYFKTLISFANCFHGRWAPDIFFGKGHWAFPQDKLWATSTEDKEAGRLLLTPFLDQAWAPVSHSPVPLVWLSNFLPAVSNHFSPRLSPPLFF